MTDGSGSTAKRRIPYALEMLFADQERDWVIDSIAAVLAWVPGKSKATAAPPFAFPVEHRVGGVTTTPTIELTWDIAKLEAIVPGLVAHVGRLQTGKTVQREHMTELAAYGLTFVAISVLMPGQKVKTMRKGSAPDILFDVTPGALRGVETAGRATGGRAALRIVRDGTPPIKGNPAGTAGKAADLRARTDIAEVHLSLWCASPCVGMMEQIKP